MPDYEFKFFFQGLCGLVPHTDESRLLVTLVDARQAHRFDGHNEDVPPHLPHVVFEAQPGSLARLEPHTDIYKDNPVRILSRQELRVFSAPTDSRLGGWDKLKPVPDFGRATKTHDGTIDSKVVTSAVGPSEKVVARCVFDAGAIGTSLLSAKWAFKTPKGDDVADSAGAMAKDISVSVFSSAPVIHVGAFAMPNPDKPVAANPRPDWVVAVRAAAEGPAAVRVRNLPLSAMYPGAHRHANTPDTHFAWHYTLLQTPPVEPWPLPYEVQSGDGGGAPGGGNPDCPRARYKPAKF